MSCSEDQFGCPVTARTDIRQVGLASEYFGRSEITDYEPAVSEEQIVGFDVSMADAEGVYVEEPSEGLIS